MLVPLSSMYTRGCASRSKSVSPANSLFIGARRTASAALDRLRTDPRRPEPIEMARRVTELLDRLPGPRAFFVRLLDPKAAAFEDVERFFREVIDPVVKERGFQRVEI